jgi:antitoxin component YwqK of YwqJK toxin-antitoxin module
MRLAKRCVGAFVMLAMLLTALGGCARSVEKPTIMKINVVDRNGLSETINSEDRLKQYENVDFLQPQPYQKVLRVYGRDQEGNVQSFLTSYHANGQPKQYLEIVNSRAFGKYREWHANGKMKLEANVIGGTPELNDSAEGSWLFDGSNHVWDEEGQPVADISYSKGVLQGESIYYHTNGKVWKRIPYVDDQLNGMMEVFLSDGILLQKAEYVKGVQEGCAMRYWDKDRVASEEQYSKGLLQTARYYDLKNTLVSEINNGNGYKARFGKSALAELHEYHQGVPEGEVKIFDNRQILVKLYHVKNGCKQGEEIEYFEQPPFTTSENVKLKPKLTVNWYEGKIQGIMKSWYKNGQLESQREMSGNEKHGVLTAWYYDGSMMLIEDYDHGKLVKGEYYQKGERMPISQIANGSGVATIFDSEGNFLKKIPYAQNHPLDM